MAALYPYEVYTLIVSELIVSHFNDVAMVYPGSEEIKKNYDSELSAVQVVNGIREKLIEDGVTRKGTVPNKQFKGMRNKVSQNPAN
ncbi:hypothetical protein [Klebsiella pneumoniae]|uniref:hypothetical protein n=1 Tax=Klebsiella pneumoniae TaxID=573 RepID=UPI002949962C|nr:hypothetical protein [Klebsiella pneumoniae]MDV5550523.1 hypothetical protein [Klebsiella pneumoniae]